MFTGLITHVTDIIGVSQTAAGRTLDIACPWPDIEAGESIAINGVCLTVNSLREGRFSVAAVGTTLERTTVGRWKAGDRVNLERALRATDRLGGHLVQGHVDGVAPVAETRREGDALILEFAMWESADGLYVPQGSICADGVSLTVYAVPAPRRVSVSVIEFTRTHTVLGARTAGDLVNIELDIVGKYIRQQAAPWIAAGVGH